MKKKLLIIDSMALIFRSFYAFNRTNLSTKEGAPTGAIYGSALFINKLINEEKPDYLICVTDTPAPTFRHDIYKEYKAHRDAMPDDLGKQIPGFYELLTSFGCPPISRDGFEADDVIGTLTRRFSGPDLEIYIVSGDKDFMQLIDENVKMYVPKKDEQSVIVDLAGVKEKFHCLPERVIDCLALIGDTADNVPGVPGIGELTAGKLIGEYGSLDGIYENIEKITAKKQKESLLANRENAYLSKRLVTIDCQVPLEIDLNSFVCRADSATSAELLAFYRKMEFKTLVKKLAPGNTTAAKETPKETDAKGLLYVPNAGSDLATPEPDSPLNFYPEPELDQIFATVGTDSVIYLYASYSGNDILADRPTLIALLIDGKPVILASDERGIYFARRFLAHATSRKVIHDLKFATHMFRNLGIDIKGPVFDLEIADYLIDPNNYNHSLDDIAQRYLRKNLPDRPEDILATIVELKTVLEPILLQMQLMPVMDNIDVPLAPVLADMERQGVYIDSDFLADYSDHLAVLLAAAENAIYDAVGEKFNINSPKQLQEILFVKLKIHEKLGIKNIKKTKNGFSTDESVLAKLAGHPVPKLILDYRSIAKLKSTYVDTLPQYTNPISGRVHTSFRQTVAATGRLSSDKPNLQNIPMRTPLGREIRKAFRPEKPDWIFISADYSQVEIRILADMAGDEDLIQAFKNGLDVHTVTAAKIFNVPVKDVDPVLRSRAKAINFGIIYGMGPMRLAQETGVSPTEAKAFIQKYFEVYPGIQKLSAQLIASAHELGYCTTLLGRRRPIPELKDSNQGLRVRGENIAINAPIQGTSADLIKLAMIDIQKKLKSARLKTKMILQVHDELVFTGPATERAEAMALIKGSMESALKTRVPLKVDIGSGSNWLEAH